MRARARLDVAAMLWARHRRREGARARFLSFDASPIHGTRIFGAREDSVLLADLDQRPFNPACLRRRVLPLTSLGHGRAHAADKALALVHCHFLEGGCTAEAVRDLCSEVRCTLTDCGVELAVADHPDVVDAYFAMRREGGASPPSRPRGRLRSRSAPPPRGSCTLTPSRSRV